MSDDVVKNKYNDQQGQRDNNRSDNNQSNAGRNRKVYLKKKFCRFCSDKTLEIDYKNYELLRKFTTEGGKIIPRRINGNCAKHQRRLCHAIKLARAIALLPYVKKPLN